MRSVLAGSDALQVGSTTLCWRDGYGCRVDVREFELAHAAALAAARDGDNDGLGHHTARALEEYRGSLLPGWYDDWALQARDELAAQCVDLCDRAAEALRSVGDLRRAAELARRRTTLAPLEESGYRLLIELQAELDDRAGAMRTYHRCASVLERELGMTPAAETTALIERLLGTDAPPPGAATGRPGTTASAGPAWYQLVGRDADVGRLMNAWDAARAGRAGAVVIIGEAGIGKSRLVGELSRDLARDGAVTALARCFETSGRPPFAPVADWLRTPALQLAKARLEPAWRAEADRLDPQSRSGTAPDVVRAKVDAWQRRRFFEGLARTVLAVQRPTLLVLEDLQWCDRETLAWIVFVMSLGSDMPLLLVATAREDQLDRRPRGRRVPAHDDLVEPADPARTRTTDAPRHRGARRAAARPAGHGRRGRPAALGHRRQPAVHRGGGARLPPAGGPGTLDRSELVDVLHRRLAQATPGARELAGLAAAVGRDFSLALLSEASDLGAEEVVLCVDELWRRRILREVGRGYDFTHDLLRDAAYDSVPPARRWLLHRRLAQGLELVHADDLDGFAGQLAEQYDRSDQPDRALRFYAPRRRAREPALRPRGRGPDAPPLPGADRVAPGRCRSRRLQLDTLRAMAPPLNALHGYASRELQSALQRAEHLAGALGRRETQLVCLVGLFASSFVQGATAESQRIGARALELAQSAPDLVGQAHFAYGGAAASLGRLTESVHHLELACELSVGDSLSVGTRSEVHSRAWMAHPLWLLGRESDAVAAAEQAVKQARTVEHPYTLAVALAYAAVLHKMRQDRGALAGVLTELTELCEHYEFAYYREWALILTGWLRGGAEGLAEVRLGVRRLTDEGSMARQPYWLCALAEAQLAVGDATAALGTLDAARSASAAFDDRFWLPEVLRLRATLLPAEHAVATLREAAALATAQQSLTLGERCRHDLGLRGPRRSVARPYAGTLTERPLPSVHLQRRSPAPEKGNLMSTATSTASAATADKVRSATSPARCAAR